MGYGRAELSFGKSARFERLRDSEWLSIKFVFVTTYSISQKRVFKTSV